MKKVIFIVAILTFPLTAISQISEGRTGIKQLNIFKDVTSPKIILQSPFLTNDSIYKTSSEILKIIAKVEDSGGITNVNINGYQVDISSNGSFYANIPLEYGLNRITIFSSDSFKNTTKLEFYSERLNPEISNQYAEEQLLSLGDGKYYALIIGIDNYSDQLINDLDMPIKDAETFYNTITTSYSFEKENVRLIKDATIAQLIEALDYYARKVRPVDNFLIFYAGHGVWDAKAENGYWLPSDAQENSKLAWFRNSTLRDYLREIKSKHTLLISDACFGGSIFKTRSAFIEASTAISKLYELPSRKAMTSGTLTEVPDQSAFLKYLIDRLEKNNEKYLSSEQLFSSFRIAVINNSYVVPQFGEIRDVGDEGGDFIFIKRK